MNADELVEEGQIRKIKPSTELAEKEFKESEYDMEHAEKSFEEKDYKWAIIKAYFAVFHSARAILFLIGLREKTHFVVGRVLDKICDDGKLESRYVADFKAALSARQGADYHYDYSKERAIEIIELAKEFIDEMEKLKEKL